MANKIGALSVDLSLETQNFLNGLKDAQKETDLTVKAFKPLTTSLKEMGEAMSVVGDVIAGAMIEATVKTAEYGAQLQHLSEKSGATVEDLAKLGFAAEQNGSSLEGLGTALKFLSKNMELASEGSKAQVQAFANLGITEKDLNSTHGSASAAFALLADRISGMVDPSIHAADLTKVLGKNWTEMLPTLELGGEELEKLGLRAGELGVVLDAETTEADLKFEQSLKQVKTALLGLSSAIGEVLIPVLTPLVNSFTNGIVSVKDFAKAHEGLTEAVFASAVAIGGTGGLLLGLSAIGIVYPTVIAGFELVGAALELLTAKMGATAVVVGVFGAEVEGVGAVGVLGGMSAGLESVGIAATGLGAALTVLTTVSLVALAAEIGYVIGSITNWGIAQLGIQKQVDSFIATATNMAIPVLGKYLTGTDALIQSSKYASDAQAKLVEALTKAGISFDGAQLGNSNYVAGLGKQLAATNQNIVSHADFVAAIKGFEQAQEDSRKATEAATAAAEKQQKAVDALKASVVPSSEATAVLAATIRQLTAEGIPAATITADLGKKAEDLEKQYALAGMSIPVAYKGIIDSIYLAYEAQKATAAGTKSLLDQETYQLTEESALRTQLAHTDVDTASETLGILRTLDTEYANGKTAQAMTTAQFLATLPQLQIDPQIAADAKLLDLRLKANDEQTKAQKALANQITSEWASAMNSMDKNMSSAFASMLESGKFNMGALVDVAKSAGDSMLKAFLDGLIKPFTDELAHLGASLTQTVLKAVGIGGGATGPGGAGSLGNLLGGIFGGGGGTPAVPQGWVPDGGSIYGGSGGGSSSGGGGGGGSSLGSAFEGIGIGAGIGLAIAGITSLYKNMAHFKADELVKNFQAPFDTNFANVITAVSNALNDGSLTTNDAQQADNDMYTLWQMASKGVDQWSVGDSGREKVAGQFHATEDTFVQGWLDWIDSITVGLGGKKGTIYSFDVGTDSLDMDRIIQAHAGEMIIPADKNPANGVMGWTGAGMTNNNSNDQSQVVNNHEWNINIGEGSRMTILEFRDILIPELKNIISNNTRDISTAIALKTKRLFPGLETA